MISVTQTKWLLRLGLPLTVFITGFFSVGTAAGAIVISVMTAVMVAFLGAFPISPIGLVFFPVIGLYGIKLSSRIESDTDLRDPDARLFLCLGIAGTLAIALLFCLRYRS